RFAESAALEASAAPPAPPPPPGDVGIPPSFADEPPPWDEPPPPGEPAPAPPRPAPRPAVWTPPEAPPASALPGRETIMAAREAAAQAETLDSLRVALAGLEGVSLKATARNLVFADGVPGAKLMLVGEAPGREED